VQHGQHLRVIHHSIIALWRGSEDGIRSVKTPLLHHDSDGQHTVEMLAALLTRSEKAEMVVGQRQGLNHSTFWRCRASGFSTCWRLPVAPADPDLNSGLRVFHTAVIQRYLIVPNGFSFSTTSTLI